ncbi:Nucleotide-sugar transporter family protein [Heracleum sosnowskyi]|uniref:Nucleotide-sugar transporter family protein n=1 Tax=Heracleum sosnowskyi TaxID=360622 RepID=A0AAD8J4E8_9APIA|nr:Nucleotide-sugar transporter family protein [Heracleum sosnowskyi]
MKNTLTQYRWWLEVIIYTIFVLGGQSVATILGRLYYDKGGNSMWMATLVINAGFPILLPALYLFSPSENQQRSDSGYYNKSECSCNMCGSHRECLMILVWTAVLWQVFSIGVIALIYKVSSLFSNVICALGFPVVLVLAVIILNDKMNGVKLISLVSYLYQHYLDDLKVKAKSRDVNQVLKEACSV